VLVGAHQKITIPVSCVEHGRWRYNSAEFGSADRARWATCSCRRRRGGSTCTDGATPFERADPRPASGGATLAWCPR
jgi:hypothetical protein